MPKLFSNRFRFPFRGPYVSSRIPVLPQGTGNYGPSRAQKRAARDVLRMSQQRISDDAKFAKERAWSNYLVDMRKQLGSDVFADVFRNDFSSYSPSSEFVKPGSAVSPFDSRKWGQAIDDPTNFKMEHVYNTFRENNPSYISVPTFNWSKNPIPYFRYGDVWYSEVPPVVDNGDGSYTVHGREFGKPYKRRFRLAPKKSLRPSGSDLYYRNFAMSFL